MQVIALSLGMGCLVDYLPQGARVTFIPNAGDCYDNPDFIHHDHAALQRLGYDVTVLDLKQRVMSYAELEKTTDILYVVGGHTFYLMDVLRQTGFDQIIKTWIAAGHWYVGASAGAVILGPSIAPASTIDDPSIVPHLISHDGLDVIEHMILPHHGKKRYASVYNHIITQFGTQFDLVPLRDNEALIYSDKTHYQRINSVRV
jgi:dipeptidase E